MKQLYDDPKFNDRVIRKVYDYYIARFDDDSKKIARLIDNTCLWQNYGTILTVKKRLYLIIRNKGYYNDRVYRLKYLTEAYDMLCKSEYEHFKQLQREEVVYGSNSYSMLSERAVAIR